MLSNFSHSLRFQIVAALLTMLIAFTAAKTFTFFALEDQISNQMVLNLAARLQLTEQHLAAQAMHYQEHAPRDFPTYSRDVQLYFQDLMGHIETFDMICTAFMDREFEPELTGLPDVLSPSLDHGSRRAVRRLEKIWTQYRRNLIEALGPDPDMPQLEAAAAYITHNRQQLELAANRLQDEVQHLARAQLDKINLINRLALSIAFLMATAIIFWFYRKVIRPLGLAAEGFRKVAQGDFGHQVQVRSNNEIAWMTDSFNHLSRRLHAIFRLIDHVQQGSDLDATLRFVGEDFSRFLPLDWLGVLFVTGDGTSMILEKAFINGVPDGSGRRNFRLQGTLLAPVMASRKPYHIPDMEISARQHSDYVFLRELVAKGMHDAIFLPLAAHSPIPGVLVFASQTANVYTQEHLELLTNIAHLVTYSFGQTVKLAEHARLAAAGEFASGVAHEIRTPLATISIALDYFKKMELPASARKRAELAGQEADRVARLLDDMLLYAKPLTLQTKEVDAAATVQRLLETNSDLAEKKHQRFVYSGRQRETVIYADPDRLVQILLNLARNACEAAPEDSEISWTLGSDRSGNSLSVDIHNEGDPIPGNILPHLFEPFFTTKPGGTGLGLSIVKRLVNAHGGDIRITSDALHGTHTLVTFPMASGTYPSQTDRRNATAE